ncbi:uncharacterized protein UDID_18364 [Ustilago sp. UG-2017a]|nr:uncharacterized protein UDID_18364 [Ustilago sp. UG-2017a]
MDDSEQDYEAIRQENIRKNAELMLSLGLNPTSTRLRPSSPERKPSSSKRRSSPTDRATPDSGDQRSSSRKSSRIASGSRPRSYRERDLLPSIARPKQKKEKKLREGTRKSSRASTSSRTKYTDWTRTRRTIRMHMYLDGTEAALQDRARKAQQTMTTAATKSTAAELSNPAAPPLPSKGGDEIYEERMPLPSREHIVDDRGRGALIFEPEFSQFRPNVTPDEMLREGAFGGTAFRDYYSRVLQRDIDVEAELAKLPEHWLEDIDVDDMLRRSQLEPSVNKFKVKAGQSLEDWEKAGWIRPIDPRGWFQWYYRFFWVGDPRMTHVRSGDGSRRVVQADVSASL